MRVLFAIFRPTKKTHRDYDDDHLTSRAFEKAIGTVSMSLSTFFTLSVVIMLSLGC